MNSPEFKGYMWKCYGFTKLHLWGCHIVASVFGVCGAGLLVTTALLWPELSDSSFQRLILLSIACLVGSGSIAVCSVFTLIYFGGLKLFQHMEVSQNTTPNIPPIEGGA